MVYAMVEYMVGTSILGSLHEDLCGRVWESGRVGVEKCSTAEVAIGTTDTVENTRA